MRSKALETVICWLNDLSGRLRYVAVPMPEWLRESGENPVFGCLGFLKQAQQNLKTKDFTDALVLGLQKKAGDDGLQKDDVAPLMMVVKQLGKSDTATQIQYVEECVERLTVQKEKADDMMRRAEKLYLTLGVSAGLMVAIVLL